jgi:serine/threonine protein phosphatase PrpC
MRLRKRSVRVVDHAALSDVGRQREGNEDSMLVAEPLFAVADGMGGAQAGEVASGLAVDALSELPPEPDEAEDALVEAITDANRRIYEKAQEDRDLAGMGTTMTAALVHDGKVTLGHVGDSRAYRWRDGQLAQLTDDHSLVAELERHGKLTAAEARVHPQRSMILRALGIAADVEVDTYCFEGREGDLFLLCTDGLCGLVHDEVIAEVLGAATSLELAASELIELANVSGGPDNITTVLFRLGI